MHTTGWAICSDTWVGLILILVVPPSAGSDLADGKLAELVEQVGKMLEYQRSVNPTHLSDQRVHPVILSAYLKYL